MILQPEERIREYTAKGWWGTQTLDDLFRRNVQRSPDAVALVDPSNRLDITDGTAQRFTYAELDRAVDGLAVRLLEAGLSHDDILAVQLPNVVELVLVYLAANRLGIIVTPMAAQYREYEVEQLVNHTQARGFITTTRIGKHAHAQMVADLRDKLPSLHAILAWGEHVPPGVTILAPLFAERHDEQLLPLYRQGLTLTANDIVTICWTSGTEAQPKGIPRSHNEWLISAYATVDAAGLDSNSSLLNPFPLINMAGIGGMLVPWLLTGSKLVMHQPLNLPVFLQQIATEQITYTVAPPVLLNMLLKNEALLAQADLSRIKVIGSGAAPLSPWMVKTWQDKFGITVLNYFGSNEGTTLVSSAREIPDPEKRAEFFPRFGAGPREWEARVAQRMSSRLVALGSDDEITQPGQPGELRLKGAAVFPGYYQAGEMTKNAFDAQGYYRTGDVFEIACDGDDPIYYHYVGRVKDIIIRGGINISAEEVELLIQGHPKVAEVAVVGYPDDMLGEKACAVVVPKPNEQVTLEEIDEFLKGLHIAAYKLPERLLVLPAMPRNPVGKVLKRDLRARLQDGGSA